MANPNDDQNNLPNNVVAEVRQNQQPQNVERVESAVEELRATSDPATILQQHDRLYRVTYIVYLWRYQNRPNPPIPKWERPKVIYVGASNNDTIQQIKARVNFRNSLRFYYRFTGPTIPKVRGLREKNL